MSIEPHPQLGVKVREDLNIYRPWHRLFLAARGCAARHYPPANPVHPGYPASDDITIKVLSDLVLLFPAAAIDMQVLADLEFILFILAILLQTLRRSTTENLTKIAKKDMILTQDFQDASKVRKDLNVYRTSAQHGEKVR